jgi:nitronate monooxygenase
MGLAAGPISKWLLRHRRTKKYMRSMYALRSLWQLKRASLDTSDAAKEYWQAGKSVAGIESIEPAGEIVRRLASALAGATGSSPTGTIQTPHG